MVTVIINGEKMSFQAKEFATFGKLYDEIAPKDKVLKSLVIDNIQVPAQKVSELKDSPLEENTEITMEFATPVEYLSEILPGILDYIETAIGLLPSVAQSLRSGHAKSFKDIESLSESISALDSLRQSIYRIVELPNIDTSGILVRLKKFLGTLEVQDISEIANSIENDLPIVLKSYQDFFELALSKIREVHSQ
ncbi:MAG TPA: hypothetical protein PLP64_03635 [Pseudothermotoga sp.]|nr:hypothetical protein [Pseudothermotoga sp.]HOK83298.1 hypothetical protein [Pseudothermotoga sp.]HPP70123.1 hypothetical protein [Pseudothermotoga sp.]